MRQVFEFGSFRLDPESQTLSRANKRVHLTAKGYSTLAFLVERAGALVSKEEILSKVWPEGFVEPANLTQTIYLVRRALDDSDAQIIETVPARGYRFAMPVRMSSRNGHLNGADSGTWKRRSLAAVASLGVCLAVVAGVYSQRDRTMVHQPINQDAQRDYVLGRHYWNERTPASLKVALHYFRAALAIQPNNARAYSGIADCYSALGYYTASASDPHYAEMSRTMALKAIAADPDEAEGHASLAFADEFLSESRYGREIISEYNRSIQLDPNYATAREWYSWYLFLSRRYNDALTQLLAARNLDPSSPIINFALGSQLFFTGKYPQAVRQWQLAISLDPSSEFGYVGAGMADEQAGQMHRAEHELRQALKIAPQDPDAMASLAHIYAADHQAVAARHLLTRVAKMKPTPAYALAVIDDALGDHHQAVKWLVTAKSQGDFSLLTFSLDPRFSKLRKSMDKPTLYQLAWN